MITDDNSENGFQNVDVIIADGIDNPEKGTEIIGRLKEKEKIVDHFLDNILTFQSDLTDISLENTASNVSTKSSKSIAEPRDSFNNETISTSPSLSAQVQR